MGNVHNLVHRLSWYTDGFAAGLLLVLPEMASLSLHNGQILPTSLNSSKVTSGAGSPAGATAEVRQILEWLGQSKLKSLYLR